ncbi:hypothetical protein QBC42DRAFT_313760 [Cladorrhinum samala]|uniref:Uncharacterized protein n=1 Tax=Cladorrhinum samala TaxID=585594 RepID=A0AAV9HX64_9PEZI|nr:hypothetical protein QBC42DRAFT_313760 [Cladorrhinum samala]
MQPLFSKAHPVSFESVPATPPPVDDAAPTHEQKRNDMLPDSRDGRGRRRVLRFWIWEIVSIAVTLGLMGAILGLLIQYNGKYVRDWKPSMNLSTLVALLSTILRASMAVVVAEILSQIKWSWFIERTRPLNHLQDFDSASRGYFGSMRLVVLLLFRGLTVPGILALMAALILIVSFAVGPFMQQAIRQDFCPLIRQDVNSSIPVTHYVLGEYFRINAGSWEASVDMKGTMLAGLTNPLSNDLEVKPFCPSGNCTFTDYGTGVTHASLGLCSKCRDATSETSGPDQKGNITLRLYPNAEPGKLDSNDPIWLTFDSGRPFLSVGWANLGGKRNLSVQGLETSGLEGAFGEVKILVGTNSPCRNESGTLICPHQPEPITSEQQLYGKVADFIAVSCTLYPCLREYNGSVVNGAFKEELVSTKPATANLGPSFSRNWTAVRSPCTVDESGTWYTMANMSSVPKTPERRWSDVDVSWADGEERPKNMSLPNACLYALDPVYASAMRSYMISLFSGRCRYDTRQGEALWCDDAKWWIASLYQRRSATFASLDKAMDLFAAAVTSKLRTIGFGPDEVRVPGQFMGGGYGVKGIVSEPSICIKMEWKWLLMPSILVVSTSVLLLVIIVRSYLSPDEPVWKASILPLLLYGLRESPAPLKRVGTMDLNNIGQETQKINVRLVAGEKREPGFVAHESQVGDERNSGYSMDSLLEAGNQHGREGDFGYQGAGAALQQPPVVR